MRWGLTDFLIAWDPFDRLSDGINQDFNSAKNWTPARRDPLALDLDGDGIETLGADGTVVFDHDGDGVKTGTGWVGADDAFLALDRNGNGSIDTGAELFGVDTVKTDGSLAVDGFDALRDLDANGDGVFDTRDSEFANVRVWRDRDRDGVSDPGELSSLTDAGILSIDLNAAHNNVDLGNGNVQTATAAHLTTAGEAGTTGNLDLAHNPFYREFTHAVALTEQAMGLPDSRGSGRVRDLREAISLSPALAAIVSAYAEQTTYAEQRAQLDALLRAWAGTSTMATSIERALANNFHLTYLMPGLSAADFLAFPRADKDNPGAGLLTLPDEEAAAQRQALLRQQARITGMIAVLERFNGDGFVTVEAESVVTGAGRRISLTPDTGSSGLTVNPLAPSHAFVTLSQRQIDLLTQSYEQLKASVYGTLAMQTRLADYADAVQLSVGGGGDMGVDFTAMNALLDAKSAANPSAALGDLIELVRYAGKSFHTQGWDGMDRLRAWIREGVGGEQAAAVLAAFNVRIADGEFTGTGGHDILFGDEQGNTLRAMAGNDIVDAGAGDDSVHGEGGDDFLIGGAGRDRLYGGAGNDTLRGGAGANDYLRGDSGDDTYLFGSGDGNTTVFNYDPGAGRNDVLRFLDGINPGDVKVTRSSNNLLLTISGTGEVITVSNFFSSDNYALNAVAFADGTLWDMAMINTLALGASEGDDNITGYAGADTLNALGGDDTLRGGGGNDTLSGGDGRDSVYGESGNDKLAGNAGDDRLYGDGGDDTLDGGAGRDRLYGGAGNDTLRGGAGNNDYLRGDSGDDTYLFGSGDGNTTVFNYDPGAGRNDVLRFLDGINPGDVKVTRSSNNLLLTISGSGEVITVSNFFSSDNYALNAVAFADGTLWDMAAINTLALGASEGDDNITGYAGADTLNALGGDDTLRGGGGNDTLSGGDGRDSVYGQTGNDKLAGNAGDDRLYGDGGDDTLDGGAGRDRLYGGVGNDTLRGGAGANDYLRGDSGDDTYLFGSGDGNTTVFNYDPGAGRNDVLRFLDGINPGDVKVTRSSNNLLLTISGTGEVITVSNFFSSDNYALNAVAFADGTLWDMAAIKTLALGATGGDDNITGYAGADTLNALGGDDTLRGGGGNDTLSGGDGRDAVYGQTGNDSLAGNAGDDRLYGGGGDDLLDGGEGRDRLYGGVGNDTLRGGAGNNDYLRGDSGDDTYVFAPGFGADTVHNYDTQAGRVDVARFDNISIEDLWFSRSGTATVITSWTL